MIYHGGKELLRPKITKMLFWAIFGRFFYHFGLGDIAMVLEAIYGATQEFITFSDVTSSLQTN